MNLNLEEFLSYLPVWDRFFDGHASTRILSADAELLEIRMRLVNLRRRLRDGPHAPLRIAFFGPTGAGKSKLFSSLIERNVSGSGYQRPSRAALSITFTIVGAPWYRRSREKWKSMTTTAGKTSS